MEFMPTSHKIPPRMRVGSLTDLRGDHSRLPIFHGPDVVCRNMIWNNYEKYLKAHTESFITSSLIGLTLLR